MSVISKIQFTKPSTMKIIIINIYSGGAVITAYNTKYIVNCFLTQDIENLI